MRKLAMAASLAALAVAVPAQASRPADPGSKGKEKAAAATSKSGPAKAKGKGRCAPRSVAYVAHGEYVSGELTQTKGADTADVMGDDRWSGTLVVDVQRTNKHGRADKGTTKTYTVTDAKVRLADRNGDRTFDLPVAGDRARVQGKVTRLHSKCDAPDFTAELKIRSVRFHAPKPAETPAPTPAPAP